MRLSITKNISKIGRAKFHKMMVEDGAFPKVKYERNSKNGLTWESYSMMDYSITWSKFMKIADALIKEKTGDELGVFTRKHSAQFMEKITEIFDSITEADVFAQSDRFRTMWD